MSVRLALIFLCFFDPVARASIQYALPLVGDFAVVRDNSRASCFLVPVQPGRSGFGFHEILPQMDQLAVSGTFITGKANAKYFLLDTAQPDAAPQIIATNDDWIAALKTNAISPAISLSTPDALAANVPRNILRPWQFRIMRNWFSLSDDEWAGVIQLAGLILSLIIGLLVLRREVRIPLVILLAIAINVIAQIFIAGGGPGAFVGFFILPLIFSLVAAFGSMVRKVGSRFYRPAQPDLH